MRYTRAVEKPRILAETCERVKTFRFDTGVQPRRHRLAGE
jgi:hypothetical protein